jgi:cation diffusion facilitator family transporter
MTETHRTDAGGPNTESSSNIAWPARVLSWLLGAPSNTEAPANGRLRYRACSKCANSVGLVGVIASAFLMVLKGYLGIVGNSTALIADAIHSSADLISALMLLVGLRVARRPADKKYPYGYGKVEFIISVVIYTLLIGAGVVIFVEAISNIVHGESTSPSLVTLFGALIAIVINEMMYRQSYCAGKQLRSPSLMANAFEKRSDALTSIAVFAGIGGAVLGFHYLDPLAAILVGFYILKFSVKMLLEAFKGLLDSALDPELVSKIRSAVDDIDGVQGIEAVRTREIGQQVWIDVEIFVDGDSAVDLVTQIKDEVRRTVAGQLGRPSRVEVYVKPAAG